ncbi:toxin HicA [Burkholderia cepacia]|uniref:toxin HicA n=1 Tax=Burkholderia cepacia TaxID=292 RepID=UPI00249E4035|nr:toxin HicA [Burkholderia cepacia]
MMASEWKIPDQMRREPASVRFNDLFKVFETHFGAARQSGSGHAIFKTPWRRDPRVNIQNDRGKANAYQVRQARDAIDRLKERKS